MENNDKEPTKKDDSNENVTTIDADSEQLLNTEVFDNNPENTEKDDKQLVNNEISNNDPESMEEDHKHLLNKEESNENAHDIEKDGDQQIDNEELNLNANETDSIKNANNFNVPIEKYVEAFRQRLQEPIDFMKEGDDDDSKERRSACGEDYEPDNESDDDTSFKSLASGCKFRRKIPRKNFILLIYIYSTALLIFVSSVYTSLAKQEFMYNIMKSYDYFMVIPFEVAILLYLSIFFFALHMKRCKKTPMVLCVLAAFVSGSMVIEPIMESLYSDVLLALLSTSLFIAACIGISFIGELKIEKSLRHLFAWSARSYLFFSCSNLICRSSPYTPYAEIAMLILFLPIQLIFISIAAKSIGHDKIYKSEEASMPLVVIVMYYNNLTLFANFVTLFGRLSIFIQVFSKLSA